MNSQREEQNKRMDEIESQIAEGYMSAGRCFTQMKQMVQSAWQAATEQGVGEAVAYMVTQSGEFCFATQHIPSISPEEMSDSELAIVPLYTHPPKPTGGGVPEAWREVLQDMYDAMVDYEMSVDECPPYKHREMMGRAHDLLLATQQPPERDADK